MEEIRIYSSIWRRGLFLGILCVTAAVMLIVNDMNKSLAALFFALSGTFLLYHVLRERLMHRPHLTITDESIIINRKGREETMIRFDEIKSFERETLTIWKRTIHLGSIIVHLKKGNGFVHVIDGDLAIKEQRLYDLLNERLKPFH